MKIKFEAVSIVLTLALLCLIGLISHSDDTAAYCLSEDGKYIKWVEFNATSKAMSQALKYDLDTYGQDVHLNWIDLLAYAGAKNGGNFPQKACEDIDKAAKDVYKRQRRQNPLRWTRCRKSSKR